ncbi:tail completion protein gp17 [Kosakonia radicincitans]|uniref:tail completion protein gp17 n=1 Tax=Kosakonia radicincitans TaxID=283686 RepID=UPI0031CE24B2
MTESDVVALIGALADGQVYPYVVPLNEQGTPSVAPPWITFTLVDQVYGDTLCGPAEENSALQVDVYSRTVDEARALREQVIAALVPLGFTQMSKTGGHEQDTGLRRATLEVHFLQ